MTVLETTITINRPVDEVFRVLTTPEDTPKWSASAIEEQLTSVGPVGVGSTRRAVVRSFGGRTVTNDSVVTEFERNRRVSMRSVSAAVPFKATWTFMSVADGTRVDWTWSFELEGFARLIGPLLAVAFKRSFERDLGRLKQMMEAGEL